MVKNILKYLRRTKDVFLVYRGQEGELVLSGYTDASFQPYHDDFRSQSGYMFCLNGGSISWRSSKQDTMPYSTTESEYITVPDTAKEVVCGCHPRYIMITMGSLLKLKSPNHIKESNTYLDDITSLER